MKHRTFIFKHFKFPITIIYNDPKESLPVAIKLLLRDLMEDGLKHWNVEETKENNDN